MSEEIKKNRPRIATERAKGAVKIATSFYANVEGKPFASVLFNGEVILTTDKEGKELNLLADVISKEQMESENAKTAKLHEYLARKELNDGKAEKIAEGLLESVSVDKAKIVQMDRAPTATEIFMHQSAKTHSA